MGGEIGCGQATVFSVKETRPMFLSECPVILQGLAELL